MPIGRNLAMSLYRLEMEHLGLTGSDTKEPFRFAMDMEKVYSGANGLSAEEGVIYCEDCISAYDDFSWAVESLPVPKTYDAHLLLRFSEYELSPLIGIYSDHNIFELGIEMPPDQYFTPPHMF